MYRPEATQPAWKAAIKHDQVYVQRTLADDREVTNSKPRGFKGSSKKCSKSMGTSDARIYAITRDRLDTGNDASSTSSHATNSRSGASIGGCTGTGEETGAATDRGVASEISLIGKCGRGGDVFTSDRVGDVFTSVGVVSHACDDFLRVSKRAREAEQFFGCEAP